MASTRTKQLTVFAPAKINLYLHVTGRLDNGYHTLDSLIGFTDIGDQIVIEPASDFSFVIEGPYSKAFHAKEKDCSPNSSNLVVQAVWALSQAVQKTPAFKMTLVKNLPLAAGVGGGSSDAAAAIWGLVQWWNIPFQASYLPGILNRLGADVPVCFRCQPTRIRGTGEILDPAPHFEEIPIVLVNPGKPCQTDQVFSYFCGSFKEPMPLPSSFNTSDCLYNFLSDKKNDLYDSAVQIVPEIENILRNLEAQSGCKYVQLSGSGATCYGLFDNESDAQLACSSIAQENPDWWVSTGYLGRPERY